MNSIEKRVVKIEMRNKRVEADKAWETSSTRKILITITTYLTVVGLLAVIGNDRPFINALVPCFGFLVSTLSVSWAKQRFIEKKVLKN